jgi:pyruvate dehydrogenase E2 component (dihydrolipoamide acetyltransferase)
MATPVEMPKLGNAVEECLLARWYKQRGETVSAGEVIASIETDKSNFELTAPVDGTLLAVYFEDGDVVPVYTTVCVVGAPGEPVGQFDPRAATPGQSAVAEAPAPSREPGAPASVTAPPATGRAISPRARRFADEHGLSLSAVSGSGPRGRILEADVKRYHEAARQASGIGAASGAAAGRRAGLTPLRRTIARRMRQSLASTAQYTLNASAGAADLLSLRARVKSTGSAEDASAVNITAMVVFCAVRALEAVPELNVEFQDEAIQPHASVHIGFACDTPRGLLVPVIRDSQVLTLPQLAAQIRMLTARAIAGSIPPDDLTGGTFTVSNLGSYGVESFSPILNPPQVAILGVNAIQLKPVRRDGVVELVDHIGLSLTCDHQVIDGAPAARFLQVVRDRIENIERIARI